MYGKVILMSVKHRHSIAFLSLLDLNLWLFRRRLMSELIDNGWEVVAITPPGDYCKHFLQIGVRHVSYQMNRRGINPFKETFVVWRLICLLRQIRPILLQTFTIKPNIYGTIAARIARVPFVVNAVTGLGSFFIEDKSGMSFMPCFLKILYQLSGSMVNRVIFQNHDDLSFFIKAGLINGNKGKLICGSGVDLNYFDPKKISDEKRQFFRKEWGIQDKHVVITMIARLIWDKGIREFCEVARRLRSQFKEKVIFMLVGDFYEGNPNSVPRAYIKNAVSRKDIIFTGWRDDMPQILKASDVIVLPSYREGVPVSLQEALAMGKPVITTDAPGCRETVKDGVNGLLVPVKDVEALSGAIRKLIINPEMRSLMGQRSREKAEREFDVEKIIKQYLELYAEISKGHQSLRFEF